MVAGPLRPAARDHQAPGTPLSINFCFPEVSSDWHSRPTRPQGRLIAAGRRRKRLTSARLALRLRRQRQAAAARASAQSSGSWPALFSRYFRQISLAIAFSTPVFLERNEVLPLGISLRSKSFCGKKSGNTHMGAAGMWVQARAPPTSIPTPELQKLRNPWGFLKINARIQESSETAKNWRIAKYTVRTGHASHQALTPQTERFSLSRPGLHPQENGDYRTNTE